MILHSFAGLEKKDFIPVYIDIMPTTSLSEFASLFIRKIVEALIAKRSAIKKIAQQLSALRLRFLIDPVSGEPSVSVFFDNKSEAEESLSTIMDYIRKSNYHFVIALDEFQKISSYTDKNTEALIRSHIQNISNISLIFSGSRRHMLTEMFSSPQRPLFGITEIMELDKIPVESYKKFIMARFEMIRSGIAEETVEMILEETGRHTYYVQYLCNRLYANKHTDINNLSILLDTICKENSSVYANYLNLLTNSQIRLLRSICLNRGVESPGSRDFISQYSLGAVSTVHQSLNSLISKEFIYEEKGKYFPFDPFMARWLRMIYR